MSHQDWKPVVFKTKKKDPPVKKIPNKAQNINGYKPVYKEDEEGNIITKKLPKDFGHKMQVARQKKGWSQKELAQKLNSTLTDIKSYENGTVVSPNRQFARRIEKILGSKLF